MSTRAEIEYRYEKLTWPDIKDAIDLGKVCILPCGAIEQHGPHLPLDVDVLCSSQIALGAGKLVPEKILVLSAGLKTGQRMSASIVTAILRLCPCTGASRMFRMNRDEKLSLLRLAAGTLKLHSLFRRFPDKS